MVKISYAIMALTMLAIMSVPTQAQSLKGLGNKIKKAAQETVNDAAGAKKAGNSTSSPSIGGLKSTIGGGKYNGFIIMGIKAGTATITVTIGSVSRTLKIRVNNK